MAFPKYKGWLLKRPDGWEDRGEVESTYIPEKKIYRQACCNRCMSAARVGMENGVAFLYCPKCLVKTK